MNRFILSFVASMLCSTALAQTVLLSVGAVRSPHYTDGGNEVCLRCHSGDRMHAIVHGAHVDLPGCEACHGPGSFHVSRAHGGKGFPKMIHFGRGSQFSDREVQINACLDCHSGDGLESDPIIWWDSVHDRKSINCSRCHQLHAEFDPIKDKVEQDRICFRCHRKQRTEHPRFEDKSIDFETLTCWTCHDVHNTMKTAESPDQGAIADGVE